MHRSIKKEIIMDYLDISATIQDAKKQRDQELQRILASVPARLHAIGQWLTNDLPVRLRRLARSYINWNPRAHPFH
ncbi:MAG: hypothetical protein K9J43_03825 [Polynucleobacter sp.]|nr:hypothetical protein [Polynucleobacter sp.]